MHTESNITYSRPTQSDITNMTVFFAEQMRLTTTQGYTQEDIEWNISEHHRRDQFEQYIYDPQIYLEIVESDGKIIGYIEARESQKDTSKMHVWWVLVHPDSQKQGIAKQLYSNLQEWMRQSGYLIFTASTKKENSVSIAFHISQGFSQIGETDEDFEFEKTL